jgi:hypothetical protein
MTMTAEAPPTTETLSEPADGLPAPCPHIVQLMGSGARFYCNEPADNGHAEHKADVPLALAWDTPTGRHADAHIVVTWRA